MSQYAGKYPFTPGAIAYLREASRVRDNNTRPRVRYYRYDESSRVVDAMTYEVVNSAPTFLDPVDLPAVVTVTVPRSGVPDGKEPFRAENVVTLKVGQGTLEEFGFQPSPRDEFEVSGSRYRIRYLQKSSFLQGNQSSLDLVYLCEYVERAANADLPFAPVVETDENV